MNLKTILAALLDAAETRWPSWKGLFELLRPIIAKELPADGGLVVMGADAAPATITQMVTDFLTGIASKVSNRFVRYGLLAFIRVVPSLLDGVWDSLFPNTARPARMESAPTDFAEAVLRED